MAATGMGGRVGRDPHPAARRGSPVATALTVALSIGALAVFLNYAIGHLNGYRVQLVVLVAINASIAIALTMTSGFTGVFSLGQIGFLAVGAYVGALVDLAPTWKAHTFLPGLPGWLAALDTSSWPHWAALWTSSLAGGTVAALVSVVVGYPLMRLSGNYVAVATMGFLIIVNAVLVHWDGVTLGSRGLNPIPGYTTVWWAYVWMIVVAYVAWRVRRSPHGRAMIATRENLIAARAVGVDVHRARMTAFVLGAFLTGVSGSFLGHQIGTVTPNAYYFTLTFNIIIMVVLGGLGSISGAVFGAVVLTLAPEYLRGVEDGMSLGPLSFGPAYGLSQIILAVGFILVMIFRPKGVFGDREIQFDPTRWRRGRRVDP
ncbi:MAG: branched-chain amino acid ABC transporter permease [Thermomicrobiales bacterium]